MSFPSRMGASPPLVGRDRERRILGAQLTRALAGQGGLALIGGEAGIGKTALAQALCREAMEQGALALVGRSYDLTETPPYGPWVELFAGYTPADGCPTAPPALARRGGVGAVGSQAALFAAVRDFFIALAAVRPVVLLFDDLHWADPASIKLLHALARAVAALPLLILLTYRADELPDAHPLAALLPELTHEAPTERIMLHPLLPDDLRHLVAARYALAETDIVRLVSYLHARADGNPLYIGELLRTLEEMRLVRAAGSRDIVGDLATAPVPVLLRQITGQRFARLGDRARALLSVAAIIGQDVPIPVWGAVTATATDTLLDVVDQADAARLIAASADGARVHFAHSLIREALYETLLPTRRRVWHIRIAETLLTRPDADPDTVAYHLRTAGDRRTAVWLYRAGARATAGVAYVMALERYGDALDLLPPSASDDAGPFSTEDENRRLAAHIHFDRGLLRALMRDLPGALADMEAASAQLDALPPGESAALAALLDALNVPADRRGMLTAWRGYAGQYAAVETLAARALADPAVAQGRQGAKTRSDVYTYLIPVYAGRGEPDAAWAAYQAACDVSEASGIRRDIAYAHLNALMWVALPYRPADTALRRHLAGEAERAFRGMAGQGRDPLPRCAQLPVLFLDGRWDDARAVAEKVAALGIGGARWAVTARVLGPLAHAQGDSARAWAMIQDALPQGPDTPPGTAMHATALVMQRLAATLALEVDDHEAARQWLTAHDRWLAAGGGVLGQAEGHLGWAAHARAIDDRPRAHARVRRALAAAATPQQPFVLLAAHRLAGELAAEAGRFADARQHLDAALTLADACAAPYERALTLLALAEMHARMGRHAAIEVPLADARATCLALRAHPALARAERIAASLPAHGSAADANLSAREIAVLRLVAAGLTNREIAAALSISAGTVKTHVLHILTKTGTANRAAATAFAQRHGLNT